MDRDEVLKRLRKMEEVTRQPAVTAVIALIEDGRPVDESLLDGMMAVVRSLAELSSQFLKLKVSVPQPAMFIPIGKGPWSDLGFARQVFPPKKENGDDQA
jgi:hypothetical protein